MKNYSRLIALVLCFGTFVLPKVEAVKKQQFAFGQSKNATAQSYSSTDRSSDEGDPVISPS